MSESFADYTQVILSAFVAIWGLILSIRTKKALIKWVQFIGIGCLGGLSIVLGINAVNNQTADKNRAKAFQDQLQKSQDRLVELQSSVLAGVTGEGNFPYLRVVLSDRIPLAGPVPIYMAVEGGGPVYDLQSWISPGSANRNADDSDYWNGYGFYRPIVYKSGVNLGLLPIGEWWVETETRNAHWEQFIRIYVEDGQIKQESTVKDEKGNVIKQIKQ